MKKRPTMLTATFVRTVNVPRCYGDGRGGLGLTLLVQPSSRRGLCKSWGQSVRIGGRRTTIGLGRYPVVTLAKARELALENARAINEGRDPRQTSNSVPTFAKALETVIAIHAENWKDRGRSEQQWRASLGDYAMQRLADKHVDEIDTTDVIAARPASNRCAVPSLRCGPSGDTGRTAAYGSTMAVRGLAAMAGRRENRRNRTSTGIEWRKSKGRYSSESGYTVARHRRMAGPTNTAPHTEFLTLPRNLTAPLSPLPSFGTHTAAIGWTRSITCSSSRSATGSRQAGVATGSETS